MKLVALTLIFSLSIPLFAVETDREEDEKLQMRVLEEENKTLKKIIREKEEESIILKVKKQAAELQEEGSKRIKESSVEEKEELEKKWQQKKDVAKHLQKNFYYPGLGYYSAGQTQRGIWVTGLFSVFLFGGIYHANQAYQSLNDAKSNRFLASEYGKHYSQYSSSYQQANLFTMLALLTYSFVVYDSFHSFEEIEPEKKGMQMTFETVPLQTNAEATWDKNLMSKTNLETRFNVSWYSRF